MPTRIAINGFGRIGRASFKIALTKPDVEIVAINDLTNARILAHLLKYDSAYGIFAHDVAVEEDGVVTHLSDNKGDKDFFKKTGAVNYIVVDGKKTLVSAEKDPALLKWKDLNVDVVLECTGRFTDNNASQAHITAGAKKVVVSAPTKSDVEQTFLLGVNHDKYFNQQIVSNASCTTNCISPVVSIMHGKFKILKSVMTTVHAITAEQNNVDGPPPPLHPDMRRARASAFNMVPTTTGAAKATTEAIPDLKNKFDGTAIRVPIITGSISDVTMLISRPTTVDEVNQAFLEAKEKPFYKGIVDATYEPIVSTDIIGSTFSAIV
ncbi:MAG TPA: glyceraldehyde 3-phosphate dehydrogenase NAD-binding domain-containing protein, partial [Candidatus Saccharimonadales bacterium]|nr:glyceraldehyde 3-phosphate dehydrogenase NAD-binding domain-containing protein [Candidatus Saccharimonadales bacterium]